MYLVTAVTWKRQPLLASDTVHEAFKCEARRLAEFDVAIGRYVIMPDHIHMFVVVPREISIGVVVRQIKTAMTIAVRMARPDVRVWQPGFYDHLLRSAESYGEKWVYVRENPVRAGLVTHHDKWPYQGEICHIRR